jgi:hypothetical protein
MTIKRYAIRGLGALAASAVLGATLAAAPANAAVTNVTSSSTVLDAALNIGGFGPEFPASGSAPPAYDVTNSFASFSTNLGPLSFSTGVLVDEASGDIATAEGQASSNLASLNITAGQFFTLTASAVGSEASVDGIPAATGSSILADLTITILGSSISIPLDPPPNDVIFDDLGVKVTLNEQIHEVEGGFGDGIIVNAIAVNLDVLGVKGFIDIAQSKASLSEAAVPEPSTWAMMALGFAGLAFAYRRSRKIAAIG